MELPFLSWDRLLPKNGSALPVVVEVHDTSAEPQVCAPISPKATRPKFQDFSWRTNIFKSNNESSLSANPQPSTAHAGRRWSRRSQGKITIPKSAEESSRRESAPPMMTLLDCQGGNFARRTTVTVETFLPSSSLQEQPQVDRLMGGLSLNMSDLRKPSQASDTLSPLATNYDPNSNDHRRTLRSSRTLLHHDSGRGDRFATVTDTFEDFTTGERRKSSTAIHRDKQTTTRRRAKTEGTAKVDDQSMTLSAEEKEILLLESRLHGKVEFQHLVRETSVVRKDGDDTRLTRTSSLAKKASQYRNSKLASNLPRFDATLSTWAMACRAVQAANDVYHPEPSRNSSPASAYTSPDHAEGTKAMIIEDQLIDGSRVVIVSIRGTQVQSLADWAVNYAAKPIRPVGVIDDEDNACHAGFLHVAKAMISLVAAQLQQHPAYSSKPSLLFTGHSAGGAVASILYTHMLSSTITSELTIIASRFSSVNCMTFGAPPVSIKTLQKVPEVDGVFLAFANEGDPVLRLSSAAYLKSLARLLAAPVRSHIKEREKEKEEPKDEQPKDERGMRRFLHIPATVRRRSRSRSRSPTRGAAADEKEREKEKEDESPVWPVPAVPLVNAGNVVLLRETPWKAAAAHVVCVEDLKNALFGDLSQHALAAYSSRVKELACSAVMGGKIG